MNPVMTLNESLDPPAVDPVLLQIANMHIKGKDTMEIAAELQVSPDRIAAVLSRSEVKEYINTTLLSSGWMNPFKQLELIGKVIEQKVQNGLLEGNYSDADLEKWMKLLLEFRKNSSPKNPSTAVQINNYDNFMKDIMS